MPQVTRQHRLRAPTTGVNQGVWTSVEQALDTRA